MAKDMKKFQSEVSNRIQALQTKAGADAFIAERKAAILSRKGKLSKSMQWQSDKIVEMMEKNPNLYIEREIQSIQKALSVLEAK
jgi:hypothetical protein